MTGQLPGGGQHAQRNRQVQRTAFLLDIGRSEIDDHDPAWKTVAGVLDGGTDAVLAFLYGGIGQAHNVDAIHARMDVHFDRKRKGVDPENGA